MSYLKHLEIRNTEIDLSDINKTKKNINLHVRNDRRYVSNRQLATSVLINENIYLFN